MPRHVKPYKRWELWEDDIVIEQFPVMTTREIHDKYLPHRTLRAIQHRTVTLGLSTRRLTEHGKPWTDNELAILNQYAGNTKPRKIHEQYLPNRTITAIKAKIAKLNQRPAPTKHQPKAKKEKFWTAEDMEVLKKYYRKIPMSELLKMLPGTTRRQVETKVLRIGMTVERTPWLEHEIKILHDTCPNLTLEELQEVLPNHNADGILYRIQQEGLDYKRARQVEPWTPAEIQILQERQPGQTPRELMSKLPGRTPGAIRFKIMRLKKGMSTQNA